MSVAMRGRVKYSRALKVRIAKRHRQGESIRQLAEEVGAAESTIRRWVYNMQAHGGPEASDRHAPDCGCLRCFRRAY